MTRSFSERNPVPIAAFGLLAIVLLLGLVVRWQQLPLVSDNVVYHAEFGDASGLVPGEEVRIAGVKVGTVRDLRLAGNKVIVDFTISGTEIGERTEAGIEVKTLLGQHFLSLTPAGDRALPEESVIPLSRTRTPVNIVPTFNQLADQTARTDTDQVAEAFTSLASTLKVTAPEMENALTGLSRLSQTVTKRDGEIATLFQRTRSVSGVVAQRDEDLGKLLVASDDVLKMLKQRRKTIRAIILDTKRLAVQLEGLVGDNAEILKPALRDLNTVLAVLRSNERNIDTALTYAAPYAREFTNVGGTGRWFDATMKFPANYSLCSTGDSTAATKGLFDPVLSAINQQVNGSSEPCLPLGPATSSGGAG
jgi:phospholipid/cholesterol/gamma-HCH transport system substrate-binding protein